METEKAVWAWGLLSSLDARQSAGMAPAKHACLGYYLVGPAPPLPLPAPTRLHVCHWNDAYTNTANHPLHYKCRLPLQYRHQKAQYNSVFRCLKPPHTLKHTHMILKRGILAGSYICSAAL